MATRGQPEGHQPATTLLTPELQAERDRLRAARLARAALRIEIVSGEGEVGTVEEHTGARTSLAGGDRWSFARIGWVRCDSAEDVARELGA